MTWGVESEYALKKTLDTLELTPRGALSCVNYIFFVITSTLGPRGSPQGFLRAYSDLTPQGSSTHDLD